MHPTRVIAISMNTVGMTDAEARTAWDRAAADTGLCCTDPVRFEAAQLVDAILLGRDAYLKAQGR